jgi:platelet-activating factor acetylhydrolase
MALEHSDGSASTARLPRLSASAASPADGTTSSSSGSGIGGGSSSAAKGARPDAAGGGGSEWCWYGGLGDKPAQLQKTRHRVAEVEAAYLLLERLNRGESCSCANR